ncbi:CHAT domain-containing protein [Actinoplanes auranticolor]|uniref:CHAT domain-containing protein n=1 Tax=Actinoplanes auranticolor TaxID=47988 RepID=A0A919SUC4_9ACTN|nr:CHAT domain-containing protein [Actinoplanes auranticolor]GIM77567.1 CHAT domain-containing protein [Actinoplanes auranticolor]
MVELATEIFRRLAAARDEGVGTLTGSEAEQSAAELADCLMNDVTTDPKLITVCNQGVILFYWERLQLMPAPLDSDWQTCAFWARSLATLRPAAVPPEVMARLARESADAVAELVSAIRGLPLDDSRRLVLFEQLNAKLEDRFEQTGDAAELDEWAARLREAIDATPVTDSARPEMLIVLGHVFVTHYPRAGRAVDHASAIAVHREALAHTTADHPQLNVHQANLASMLTDEFAITRREEQLSEAIALATAAVAGSPDTLPNKVVFLGSLGKAWEARFAVTRELGDLDEAIVAYRRGLSLDGAPQLSQSLLSHLPSALWDRFGVTAARGDLDECIASARMAVPVASGATRVTVRNLLAVALQTRFSRDRNEADIDEAVESLVAALTESRVGDPAGETVLGNLTGMLVQRGHDLRRIADFDHAIALIRHYGPGRSERGTETRLAEAWQGRFLQTDDRADLDEMISALAEVLQSTDVPEDVRFETKLKLVSALANRSRIADSSADADEAIKLAREAAELQQTGVRDARSVLAEALLSRSRFRADLADAIEAVEVLRELEEAIPPGGEQGNVGINLAGALRQQAELTGSADGLEEALELLHRLSTADRSHPHWRYLSSICGTMQLRYEITGNTVDLDDAVAVQRQVVDEIPAEDGATPGEFSNLSNVHRTRFESTGQLPDLDDAVAAAERAVETAREADPDRHMYLSNLGLALYLRYKRAGAADDVERGVQFAMRAVSAAPADPYEKAGYLSNLGVLLLTRFDINGRDSDLDEALRVLREAAGVDHPRRARRLLHLSSALRQRFDQRSDSADLDEAVDVGRRAVAMAESAFQLPTFAVNLGNCLRARFDAGGDRADLTEALDSYRKGADATIAAPASRLTAALAWARTSAAQNDFPLAVEAYQVAIELLPLAAWVGLDRASRVEVLRSWSHVASEAAATALAAGKPRTAVELLEAGRTIIWSQSVQLRQDLSQIADAGLVQKLNEASAVLNNPFEDMDTPSRLSDGGPVTSRHQQERRRRAARTWADAVAAVRRQPGLEGFLRPEPYETLREAAADGPVIIVNVAHLGSHALIVRDEADQPQVVDLPDVSLDRVVGFANTLLWVQWYAGMPGRSFEQRETDRHAVFDLLDWLWTAIAEPVLQEIDETRVWWCTVGPVALLPLHAAGIHPRTRAQAIAADDADGVPERVISSYALTLSALRRARLAEAPTAVRQLAIGVPDAAGQRELPAVAQEITLLGRYLPEPHRATHLVGDGARWQAAVDELPRHNWLHISSHGVRHDEDTSLSAFLLHDRPLTLRDIAALHLRGADLAYLAACQTASGGGRLLDEGLHLTAALQFVGYRHVLGTMWNVADALGPAMAQIIYEHLTQGGAPDSSRAAFALHEATRILRQRWPDEPMLWGPYVHFGP